jgi:hypothetical protein
MKQKIVLGLLLGVLLNTDGTSFCQEQGCVNGEYQDMQETVITQEESTVIEHALEHMLMRMAENQEEPKESLLRLYQAVTEHTEISIEDLNELLPEIIECMKEEKARSNRPDAPGIGNGAISGCCGCCDLSQIIAILGSIQAKLVIINNLIIQCCDEIRFDFQATWSILANLKVTATVDLSPVFSVITNCCNGTFSAIANLKVTATTDLSGVFSALAACCNGTFSTLANLKVTTTVDFSPVFTAIAACCNSTFSMLDKIDREIIGTFSVINACCNGTFTAIAACCNSTFSMLDKIDKEIIGTFSVINACCNGTFTAIAACCNGTFSTLANLKVTATTDLSGVFSALAACCNGTFSVLANLKVTATTDLSGVFSAIAACCNGTFTSLFDIKNTLTACAAIPIFTSTNITASGNYCLARDIIGTITISSSEVHLDLNGFSIISTDTTGIVIIGLTVLQWGAISVNNSDNVTVRNGQLYKLGIFARNCNNLMIDSVSSFSCQQTDIDCATVNGLTIRNYAIFNHAIGRLGTTLLSLASVNNTSIQNFSANKSQYTQAFSLTSVDGFQISNVFLNAPGVASPVTLNSAFISNCNFNDMTTEAGQFGVVTGTGIILENIQQSGSTNGFLNMTNVRNLSVVNCLCRDAASDSNTLNSIATGTNIVITNFNAENCTALFFLDATRMVDGVFEGINISESAIGAPGTGGVININNMVIAASVGTQATFKDWTINNCTVDSLINITNASDIEISEFKVTNNNSTSQMNFVTLTNAPKVNIDDCIFSDNASTGLATGNIIFANNCDFTRINNVIIEKNTYAGAQNGIVVQASVVGTFSGSEITNCRIENNTINSAAADSNLIQINGIRNPVIKNNTISGNNTKNDVGRLNAGIFNTVSDNALIIGNNIIGNIWTGSGDVSLIQTSTIASIEYNEIIGNRIGNNGMGINAGGIDHTVIRGNVVNYNQGGTTPVGGTTGNFTGLSASGANVVLEKNIATGNFGTPVGSSIGFAISGAVMVTMNEAQGQVANYSVALPLVIPIATLSYSTGVVTPVPAPLSSYHNLSMIP